MLCLAATVFKSQNKYGALHFINYKIGDRTLLMLNICITA